MSCRGDGPLLYIMLSYLDPILFPDECEILQLPNGRFIYPIYKNGSSSLHRMGLPVVKNLADCKEIDVLIREPYERFLSGVNTFIKNLDPGLDKTTILYFVKNYLFLNRHYCPQFFWLLNLQRFSQAKIRLLRFSELNTITTFKNNISPENYMSLASEFNNKVHFYLQLDKILYYDLINQTVDFKDIIHYLKTNYTKVYDEIITRSKNLCSVLD